ncbi:thiamine/thiamine pyrophosphate ABC transporter permease [Tianweitania populi]|uniref:Thiamine transport system permease protein ThiP n=1 Tax=Tianweitania populi TaxID=1607949 RepID=A0A8J3DRS2_9HYPH|nr:thiamine/thiamine pyrophosphate ABC transporter permease [Tianweitania populi]GHD18589.1 thiamine/thiamine pyrophosphate ABC transporter, permease protein [Tianweitania populi]
MKAARRTPADPRFLGGALALGLLTVLIGGAFVGLIAEGARNPGAAWAAFDSYLLRIIRFTLMQALLSTALSILPALLVARALSRHPTFPGRHLILQLFAVPLALPAIVAALGLLALLGRAGFLAPPLGALTGEPWPGIYGLSGILIAHVFFNLPMATRLFLEALETVPTDQHRLGVQLGFKAWNSFRFIEWPALRKALPSIAGLVFMLCVTSFTLVLTLGGGPRATTLEVAIYQALRFDFDPSRAVALTLVQLALTVIILALLSRLGADAAGEANLSVAPRRFDFPSPRESIANGAILLAAVLFVVSPLAATGIAGLSADLQRLASEGSVHSATLTSLWLAFSAAAFSILLSFALVRTRHALQTQRRDAPPSLFERLTDRGAGYVLVVPPIVIGAGWFILLRTVADLFALAPIMVITVNGVMAMPFALRLIRPAHDAAATRHDRLCASLGITGWNRLRLIDWPSLRRPLLAAFAFAMALSLGDLGVIALFGSDAVKTLPYLLLERMGSYRTADAAGLGLFLALLTLALMLLSDRLGRSRQ